MGFNSRHIGKSQNSIVVIASLGTKENPLPVWFLTVFTLGIHKILQRVCYINNSGNAKENP